MDEIFSLINCRKSGVLVLEQLLLYILLKSWRRNIILSLQFTLVFTKLVRDEPLQIACILLK